MDPSERQLATRPGCHRVFRRRSCSVERGTAHPSATKVQLAPHLAGLLYWGEVRQVGIVALQSLCALPDGANIDRNAGRIQDQGMCMNAASIVNYHRRLN